MLGCGRLYIVKIGTFQLVLKSGAFTGYIEYHLCKYVIWFERPLALIIRPGLKP